MSNKDIAVSLRGITKSFGRITANKAVDLDIRKGEILSLLGENGSGKTSLMNMLAGIYFPDAGQIFINGKEVVIHSPKDAFALGIGMVHQHFKLIDVFNAVENIVLGLEGGLNLKAAEKKIMEICDKYGFDSEKDYNVYLATSATEAAFEERFMEEYSVITSPETLFGSEEISEIVESKSDVDVASTGKEVDYDNKAILASAVDSFTDNKKKE